LSAAVDRFGGECSGPQANDLSLMPRGEADAAARLPESPARQCYIKRGCLPSSPLLVGEQP